MNDIEYRFRELEIELQHLKVAFAGLQEKYHDMSKALEELDSGIEFYLDDDEDEDE